MALGGVHIYARAVRGFRGIVAPPERRGLSSGSKEWLQSYLQGPQSGAVVAPGLGPRQRRIMFRSRQRGWLELDVLLGSWASKYVPSITDEKQLADIEGLLTVETPHLYEWIVGQSEAPPPFTDSETLKSMQRFSRGTGTIEDRLQS